LSAELTKCGWPPAQVAVMVTSAALDLNFTEADPAGPAE